MNFPKLILKKILTKHIKSIRNLNIKNPKLIIAFSGIPGSGKTYISERIENHYKAIRINTDKIRNIIKILFNNTYSKEQINIITDKYMIFLFNKLNKNINKTIILDCSIDRRYAQIKKFVLFNKYNIFIICMEITKRLAIKRIKIRNYPNSKPYLEKLNKWIEDQKRFLHRNKVDIIINFSQPIYWNKIFSKIDIILKNSI